MTDLFKKQKYQYFLSLLLFLVLFCFGYHHASQGINLADEGLSISQALRFSLGDLPFRDESMSFLSQSGVLLGFLFDLFPHMPLFQVRLLGLFLQLASLIAFFSVLSRYTQPLFTAAVCCLMFFANNVFGILTPGYDLLSITFSLLSLSAWLAAMHSGDRLYRALFSLAAGLFLCLAVLSYSTLFLMFALPVAAILAAVAYPRIYRSALVPSLLLLFTAAVILAIISWIVMHHGLWPDFVQGFAEAVVVTNAHNKGVVFKLLRLGREYLRVIPYGIGVIGMTAYALLAKGSTRTSRFDTMLRIIGMAAGIALLMLYGARRIDSSFSAHAVFPLVILSITVPLTIMTLLSLARKAKSGRDAGQWISIASVSLAWGIASLMIYGISSMKGIVAAVQGITPLFVVGMTEAYNGVMRQTAGHDHSSASPRGMMKAVFAAALSMLFCIGAGYYYRNIYFNQNIETLTTPFNHPKLKGIYSTPGEVLAIEGLLAYLSERVRPSDYLLIYNGDPMLYYLAHARPAYGTVWARDDRPAEMRRKFVSRMIENGRVPEYCVRVLAPVSPPYSRYGITYDDDSPLDAFVRSNYYVEEILFPYEIWRRGPGPGYRLFDGQKPLRAVTFSSNPGAATGNPQNLSGAHPPFHVLAQSGKFFFAVRSYADGNALRISPVSYLEGSHVEIGISLAEKELQAVSNSGGDLLVLVSGRLSASFSDLQSFRVPTVFIAEGPNGIERNSTNLYTSRWERYSVRRRIPPTADQIFIGFSWWPRSMSDWLEIRDLRVLLP